MPKIAAAAVVLTTCLAALAPCGFAQERPAPAPAVEDGSAAPAGRVAVPEPSAEALRYHRSGNVLWVIGTLWGLAVPALLLFTGFSARMRDWARRIGRRWFFVIALYFVFYSLVTFVLDLPLSYYAGFVREHAYGLSNQTLGKWAGDAVKGLLIGIVFGALTLWVPYLLLRKSPRRWWLYSGLLTAPLLLFLFLVSPIWIEPLFNEFGPMKDKALEARILALAQRAGIEGSRVYEVEKSVDTETINAYVAGLFQTQRIVLWDTLLAKLDDEEVLFVMGHEMGHYVLGHSWRLVLLGTALALLGFFVIHATADALLDRFHARFGFRQLADVASLPLIALLFSLTFLALAPAVLSYTRKVEHDADRFGLEITRGSRAAAAAFVKLQEQNLDIPRPGLLYQLWRSSHPPLGERIDFANEYRPWETGEPLRYEALIGEGK